jgi:hypothetical protein
MKNEIIMPNYQHCILNTITSILKYYNVATPHSSLNSLDKKLNKKYKNIILLVLDGMGSDLLDNISPDGYLKKNQIDCVTSVYPSTTTAALTTYYSGKPPYETGWIAWSQYFKEYGRTIDMFSHKESYLGQTPDYSRLNVFEGIMNYLTVFEMIEKASPNVKAYEVTPLYSERRSKRTLTADNFDELIDHINVLCQTTDEKFIMAYCDNPDSLLHKYGTSSSEVYNFVTTAQEKIDKLYSQLPEDTLLIISADHGHKDVEKCYTLLDYPEIQECLIMPAYLESRVISFWVKENMKKEFEERFNKVFRNEFWLLTKEEFLKKNFLGFGQKHPKIDDFLGNYIALSISSSIIRIESFLAEGKTIKKSTHCGLSKEEMEVPLIVIEK